MIHLTFDKAYSELEKIIKQIEGESIPLDDLAEKVREAKELIRFCEEKLRGIENQLSQNDLSDKS
jgi:exodeoxyribonuclease VII small subunit